MKIGKSNLKLITALTAGTLVVLADRGLGASEEKDPPPAESLKKSKEGDFIRGARLWVNNCGRCHNVRDPKDLNDREWKLAMSHMRIRAGLTGQDTRDILKFLTQNN